MRTTVDLTSDPYPNTGLTMFIFLSFIVRVIVSPSMTLLFVGCMYSFFWMPQIVRSARRGRSSGLTIEYLVGTTVCRLYFALCELFLLFFLLVVIHFHFVFVDQIFWHVLRMFLM